MWLCGCWYCPLPVMCTRYEPLPASQMTVAGGHMFLASLRTEIVCPAKSWDIFLQLQQSWYVALWKAHSSRQSKSGAGCGSVFHIHYGTVMCNVCWYRSSTGEHRCTLMGLLLYARRASYGSWSEHFSCVRSPLMIFTAASALPLFLGFLGALVLWSNFHSCKLWVIVRT